VRCLSFLPYTPFPHNGRDSERRRDTPTRYAYPELPLGMRQKTAQLEEHVAEEMVNYELVATKAEILKKLFPPKLHPESIFDRLRANSSGDPYDTVRCEWKAIPKAPDNEALLYDPFVKLAREIQRTNEVKEYLEQRKEDAKAGRDVPVRGVWVNCSAKSPKSPREETPLTRPDLGLFTGTMKL